MVSKPLCPAAIETIRRRRHGLGVSHTLHCSSNVSLRVDWSGGGSGGGGGGGDGGGGGGGGSDGGLEVRVIWYGAERMV